MSVNCFSANDRPRAYNSGLPEIFLRAVDSLTATAAVAQTDEILVLIPGSGDPATLAKVFGHAELLRRRICEAGGTMVQRNRPVLVQAVTAWWLGDWLDRANHHGGDRRSEDLNQPIARLADLGISKRRSVACRRIHRLPLEQLQRLADLAGADNTRLTLLTFIDAAVIDQIGSVDSPEQVDGRSREAADGASPTVSSKGPAVRNETILANLEDHFNLAWVSFWGDLEQSEHWLGAGVAGESVDIATKRRAGELTSCGLHHALVGLRQTIWSLTGRDPVTGDSTQVETGGSPPKLARTIIEKSPVLRSQRSLGKVRHLENP